ncbi:MAG: hypothetical protein EOO45_00735 [Flavobacterium sp.]|nr:MAG: hypothetical protein EOO45_00735 [Flavobacterium sp.]
MKTILITGIGGPTPRSIAKTIREGYPDYKIVGVDANPKALGFFMPGLVDKFYLAPKVSNENYWTFIKDLIAKENIDMAFVQPEKEVIAWGQYDIDNGGFPCPVLIPGKELALTLMDKSIMADVLKGTHYIPKTIKVTQDSPKFDEVENEIGFPCWIRATQGSGGLGSLRLTDISSYKSWLFINSDLHEFTVSEFLTGRHLATQMLYVDGKYIKGASLECAEYVMASIAPSKVTGNTSFGRFLNEDDILEFCNQCIEYICEKLNLTAHGVLSFDLKEDDKGAFKVTEVNIRHMAYTGVMSEVGFDLVSDTIKLLNDGVGSITEAPYFRYDKPYVFLRDVDTQPLVLDSEELFNHTQV